MQLEGLGSAVDSPNRVWGGNRIWCIYPYNGLLPELSHLKISLLEYFKNRRCDMGDNY